MNVFLAAQIVAAVAFVVGLFLAFSVGVALIVAGVIVGVGSVVADGLARLAARDGGGRS